MTAIDELDLVQRVGRALRRARWNRDGVPASYADAFPLLGDDLEDARAALKATGYALVELGAEDWATALLETMEPR